MTRVINIRHGGHYDVYIGRPSRYGNPYLVGRDGSREMILDRYRDWLNRRQDREAFLLMVQQTLHDKVLGCFCKPLACHGDILAAIANSLDLLGVTTL